MLDPRPNCECCDRDLPPDSPDAMICSHGCTWCADCVDHCLDYRCPNCGGDLAQRPIGPPAAGASDPASTVRIFQPGLHRG